ncbi:hypothetical protein, partial [Alloyangia mangrovi]|uniref:hypothetical protein n=1 Tax=Alloyangia mangrovi TaxID=1779329 RepID=UPI002889357D
EVGETHARDKADVTGADNCDFHKGRPTIPFAGLWAAHRGICKSKGEASPASRAHGSSTSLME